MCMWLLWTGLLTVILLGAQAVAGCAPASWLLPNQSQQAAAQHQQWHPPYTQQRMQAAATGMGLSHSTQTADLAAAMTQEWSVRSMLWGCEGWLLGLRRIWEHLMHDTQVVQQQLENEAQIGGQACRSCLVPHLHKSHREVVLEVVALLVLGALCASALLLAATFYRSNNGMHSMEGPRGSSLAGSVHGTFSSEPSTPSSVAGSATSIPFQTHSDHLPALPGSSETPWRAPPPSTDGSGNSPGSALSAGRCMHPQVMSLAIPLQIPPINTYSQGPQDLH
ncbi:hypothetical protein WJX79_004234 [Trebouxia sp. C0005]